MVNSLVDFDPATVAKGIRCCCFRRRRLFSSFECLFPKSPYSLFSFSHVRVILPLFPSTVSSNVVCLSVVAPLRGEPYP